MGGTKNRRDLWFQAMLEFHMQATSKRVSLFTRFPPDATLLFVRRENPNAVASSLTFSTLYRHLLIGQIALLHMCKNNAATRYFHFILMQTHGSLKQL